MPQSVDELVALLDLELIEDDLFRGRQPDTSLQRVFGGQVLGQALAAAYRAAPGGREVHSLHAYFLRPGDPAVPIIYDDDAAVDEPTSSSPLVLISAVGQTDMGQKRRKNEDCFLVEFPGVPNRVAITEGYVELLRTITRRNTSELLVVSEA